MEGHVPHRTSCTFVPMIWIMQYSDAHSSNFLCTAFMAVTHFWPFFCICAFYGRLSLAYKFSSSADPISLSVLCPWRQRRSLSVAACWANCERCHVGRCGEGEELWDSNLKFKCFERYERQLFEEHCTPFFSCWFRTLKILKYSYTATQKNSSRVLYRPLSSPCMELECLRVKVWNVAFPPWHQWKVLLIIFNCPWVVFCKSNNC